MNPTFDRVIAEALNLPAAERARLARDLIASLDAEVDDDPAEVRAAWEEEIGRRIEEYRSGSVDNISAEDVFAEARALLR